MEKKSSYVGTFCHTFYLTLTHIPKPIYKDTENGQTRVGRYVCVCVFPLCDAHTILETITFPSSSKKKTFFFYVRSTVFFFDTILDTIFVLYIPRFFSSRLRFSVPYTLKNKNQTAQIQVSPSYRYQSLNAHERRYDRFIMGKKGECQQNLVTPKAVGEILYQRSGKKRYKLRHTHTIIVVYIVVIVGIGQKLPHTHKQKTPTHTQLYILVSTISSSVDKCRHANLTNKKKSGLFNTWQHN